MLLVTCDSASTSVHLTTTEMLYSVGKLNSRFGCKQGLTELVTLIIEGNKEMQCTECHNFVLT